MLGLHLGDDRPTAARRFISRRMGLVTRRGRYMDNLFVERLWRSLKYEEVYLNAYASVAEAKAGIGSWLDFYNQERQHQSLSASPDTAKQNDAAPYARAASFSTPLHHRP